MRVPVDKMSSDIVQFLCPACGARLQARRPAPEKKSAAVADKKKSVRTPADESPLTSPPPSFSPPPASPPGATADEKKQAAAPADGSGPGPVKECGPPQDGARKRGFTRYPFKKKILVDRSIMIEGIDISEGGLFVHTGRSFKVGSVVSVALPLPSGELMVDATVQHNTPGIGMGLQFCNMPANDRKRLQDFFKSEMTDAQAAAQENKKRVLLVGGNETARRIAKSKLVLEGFLVLEASTLAETLKKIVDPPPDVVIIDWQDKAIDGLELLAKIKEDPRCCNTIKIVLTAVSNQAMREKISKGGADECLAKMDTPPVKLAERIKEIVASRG